MGMKSNNMSEIENSRWVTVRLLDPLKMLQHLVLEESDLVKAHHSCADQMDRSPAQQLTDGALKKSKEMREPPPANAYYLLPSVWLRPLQMSLRCKY